MPEEPRQKNIKKKDIEQVPNLKESIMAESKETTPESSKIPVGMFSVSVVIGEVSIGISVPDTSLQDIAQIILEMLKNIAEIRSGEIENAYEQDDELTPEKPQQNQDDPRGLDLEGNEEYEKLMGKLKEEPRTITPPEEP
jgi:hypothetical protein